jgi:hypothetical protein
VNGELAGLCSVTINPDLRIRLTHSLLLVSDTPVPGAWRAKVGPLAVVKGDQLGGRAPNSDDGPVNDALTDANNGFGPSFAAAVNARMVIPAAVNVVPWTKGLKITDPNDLDICTDDSQCKNAGNGPEDGCFKPDAGKGLVLSPDPVDDAVNAELQKQGKGACLLAHLEPKRVSIGPDGLDLVLIEDASDKQFQAVSGLTSLKRGIVCGKPSADVSPELSKYRVGELKAAQATAKFAQ